MSELGFQVTTGPTHLCVRPSGTLDGASYRSMRDTLLKYATDEPTALIVDLADVRVTAVELMSVFYSVWIRVSEWPGTPLVLVTTDPRLAATAVTRFVPVAGTFVDALASLPRQPARRRVSRSLPHLPASSRHARELVRAITADWLVPRLADPAAAIVTEFVENAIVHTWSDPRLRLELRRGIFSIAVSDDDPRHAVLREGEYGIKLPSGLAVVAATARAWGCNPTPSGGKVVWATLRVSGR